MIASGVAGYIGWTLWGTGLITQRAQDSLRPAFVDRVDTKDPAQAPPDRLRLPGTAYAQLIIPRIGLDMIVMEGVDAVDL